MFGVAGCISGLSHFSSFVSMFGVAGCISGLSHFSAYFWLKQLDLNTDFCTSSDLWDRRLFCTGRLCRAPLDTWAEDQHVDTLPSFPVQCSTAAKHRHRSSARTSCICNIH